MEKSKKKDAKFKGSKKMGQKKRKGGAAGVLRKLGERIGITGLSTTQKVVAATTLAALGLSLLAKRRGADAPEQGFAPSAEAQNRAATASDE